MKRVLIALGILVVAGAAVVLWAMVRGGTFRTVEAHFDGRCTAIGGIAGAEDIVVDHKAKRAWISADDRRARMAGEDVRGRLVSYDLSSPAAQPKDATPDLPYDFHPHGLSLWQGADGAERLFVINHQSFGGHRIEVFDVADGRLSYAGGIVLPELRSPNAIVAVGENQFYVANDHGSATATGRWLEQTFALPRADVVYFDGARATIVAEGLRFPSGIEVSADGTRLWVGEATGGAVRVYGRDVASGLLREETRIALDTAPDNLRRDDSGTIWTAAHPKLGALLAHFGDAAALSPTQVIRFGEENGAIRAEEILLDGGETLSAGSVAAVSGRRLLIGAIMDPRFLDCTLP